MPSKSPSVSRALLWLFPTLLLGSPEFSNLTEFCLGRTFSALVNGWGWGWKWWCLPSVPSLSTSSFFIHAFWSHWIILET